MIKCKKRKKKSFKTITIIQQSGKSANPAHISYTNQRQSFFPLHNSLNICLSKLAADHPIYYRDL